MKIFLKFSSTEPIQIFGICETVAFLKPFIQSRRQVT